MPDMNTTPRTIEAEIFSAGTWNGETFTREDLEEIARNFALLGGVLKPPLKFGHDAEQTLLGQADGDPALGWVEALRVEDDKLIATFAGVPEVVHDAIRGGLYRRVSAELYFDVRHEGRALGKALKAVALLGADLPAVTNLGDLTAYLDQSSQQGTPVFAWEGDVRRFTLDAPDGKIGGGMTTADTALERELMELRAFKAREETRRRGAELEAVRTRLRESRRAAAEFTQRAVGEGRMPPYLRERLLGELDAQLTAGSSAPGSAAFAAPSSAASAALAAQNPLAVSLDWVEAFVAAVPATLPAGEVAFAADPAPVRPDDEDPSRALARLASAKMVELNLSYGKAADYVLNTNPGLAQAYRAYILKANLGG